MLKYTVFIHPSDDHGFKPYIAVTHAHAETNQQIRIARLTLDEAEARFKPLLSKNTVQPWPVYRGKLITKKSVDFVVEAADEEFADFVHEFRDGKVVGPSESDK